MRIPKKAAVLILVLLAICSPGFQAGETAGLEYASSILWSKAYDVQIEGNYAYCGFLNGLVILDLADRRSPAAVAQLYLGGGFDVEKVGNLVFVAAGNRGLKVVDVSDPRAPVVRGEVATSGPAKAVAASGGHVFVAAGSAGLLVFDVAKPGALRLVATLDTPGEAEGVTLASGTAFVADGEAGLLTVDIRSAAAPKILGSLNLMGTARQIALTGKYALVADGAAGLAVVDVSNPSAPRLAGSMMTSSYANSIAASGPIAVAGTLYDGGFQVLDIQKPAEPKSLAILKYTMYNEAWGVGVEGNRAVIVDYFDGLHFVDLANPQRPVVTGRYFTPSSTVATAVREKLLVAIGELSGLQVYDISDASRPRKVGASSISRGVQGLDVQGDYAYVTERRVMNVLNLAELPVIKIVKSFPLAGVPRAIVVRGQYAYLTSDHSGFHVVDVSDPKAPKLAGSLPMTGFAYGLTLAGDRAYICSSDTGFHVLDIAAPAQPKLLGSFRTAGEPRACVVLENLAFVADGPEGVVVLDVSRPEEIKKVGEAPFEGFATGIAAKGKVVYVSDETMGVRAFDISAPGSPKPAASFRTTGEPAGVKLVNDLVIVPDAYSLFILKTRLE